MTETVVHVTTLEQWRSVLDIWFKRGYKWNTGDTEYSGYLFTGHKYLVLQFFEGSSYIHCTDEVGKSIEYSDFMAQQKEDKEVKTYYVTQEQLDLIEECKYKPYPAYQLINSGMKYHKITSELDFDGEKALLRYIGGDETIEFKVKEPLYRLWRIDGDGDKVYMTIDGLGTPYRTVRDWYAFTAPLEEIKKWQTPAWEIEEVN